MTEQLKRLGDELRFVLITSAADVKPLKSGLTTVDIGGEKMAVSAVKSAYKKCGRCWHYRQEVGSDTQYSDLCQRCIDNIEGEGEMRHFA